MIVYRRSDQEMTARVEEHHHAIEEGVEFHWLTNPVEVLGNEDGWVTGLKCIKMKLGEPDESGRARPVPIEGSEFVFPVDNVAFRSATSRIHYCCRQRRGSRPTSGAASSWKTKRLRPRCAASSRVAMPSPGQATVILAAGAGKSAAATIHKDLCS